MHFRPLEIFSPNEADNGKPKRRRGAAPRDIQAQSDACALELLQLVKCVIAQDFAGVGTMRAVFCATPSLAASRAAASSVKRKPVCRALICSL
jgi:hypothetical protein